jgi:hypothetical protein
MPHRIIYSLRYWLEPLPTDPPGSSTAITVQLNRAGISCGRNSRPRHKKRTIDLRVGDELMCNGRWRKIVEIEADRQGWLNDEKAAARTDDYGYSYRLPGETRTAEEMRELQGRAVSPPPLH